MNEINIPDEYADIQMNSSTIIEYYNYLLIAIIENDDENFKLYLELLKEIIQEEIQNYQKIQPVTAMGLLSFIDADAEMPLEVNRYYHRLKEKADLLTNMPKLSDGTTLYTVLKSKITIDTFKEFYNKRIKNSFAKDEKQDLLQKYDEYLIMAAIVYFTDSTFLEQLTLNNNFNILQLPSISIDEIKEMFKLSSNEEIEEMLYMSILASINSLCNINTDMLKNRKENDDGDDESEPNEYYETMSIIDLIRIEIQLKLISEETRLKLSEEINRKYKNDNSQVMKRVKIMLNIK